MAATHHSPNIPSFDLGISDNEDISHLIVEDSLNKDEETDTGEVMFNNDDEATTKETELSSNGIYNGVFKQVFDLNKVPDEGVNSVNVCDDVEEAVKFDKVKNLRQKVVQPDETVDLNKGVFDLNKLPDEGLDFGFENDDLKKGVDDILKIYIDSLN